MAKNHYFIIPKASYTWDLHLAMKTRHENTTFQDFGKTCLYSFVHTAGDTKVLAKVYGGDDVEWQNDTGLATFNNYSKDQRPAMYTAAGYNAAGWATRTKCNDPTIPAPPSPPALNTPPQSADGPYQLSEGASPWLRRSPFANINKIVVTNLNDSGAGSLRNALTTPGPREVVFDSSLSGKIWLSNKIRITSLNGERDFLWLTGSPTVEVKGAPLEFYGARYIYIRDLICRPGSQEEGEDYVTRDCISFYSAITQDGGRTFRDVCIQNSILDGGTDECLSFFRGVCSDIWVIGCKIGPGKSNKEDKNGNPILDPNGNPQPVHPKGPHSYGMLTGSYMDNILVMGCWFHRNMRRSPMIGGGQRVFIVNCLVSEWGSEGSHFDIGQAATGKPDAQRAQIQFQSCAYVPRTVAPPGSPFANENLEPPAKVALIDILVYASDGAGTARPLDTTPMVPWTNAWAYAARKDVRHKAMPDTRDPGIFQYTPFDWAADFDGWTLLTAAETAEWVLSHVGVRADETMQAEIAALRKVI